MESATAHYYRQYYIGTSESYAVVVWPRGGRQTETNQRCIVISLVTTLTGNPVENAHSKNRNTMRLCCMFSNSMECSAICHVLIDQVMLNYVVSLLSRSECLPLVRAITSVIITVLDFGLCLCLSNSNRLFLLTEHLRSLNIGIDFNIYFLSDSSSNISINIT